MPCFSLHVSSTDLDKLQLVGLSDILWPPAGVVNSSGGRTPGASLPFCQLNGAFARVASIEVAWTHDRWYCYGSWRWSYGSRMVPVYWIPHDCRRHAISRLSAYFNMSLGDIKRTIMPGDLVEEVFRRSAYSTMSLGDIKRMIMAGDLVQEAPLPKYRAETVLYRLFCSENFGFFLTLYCCDAVPAVTIMK